MAERPVFLPVENGAHLVQEVLVPFVWHPGMAPSEKKKNVAALHEAATERGLGPLLEISSKSEREIGRRLSAFYLKLHVNGREASLESCYQGSKVFEHGGPYNDLYLMGSREAKQDPRLKNSGRLIKFHFEGKDYPLSPGSVFYDWLYLNALYPHREWLKRVQLHCAGFTDIEFNPQRSFNCQARSFATFVALEKRAILDEALKSFESFRRLMQTASI